jgi:hypothetical protein
LPVMSPEVFFLLPLLILDAVTIMQYKFISHSLQPRGQTADMAESNAFFHREPSHFSRFDFFSCSGCEGFVSPYFRVPLHHLDCLTVTLTNSSFSSPPSGPVKWMGAAFVVPRSALTAGHQTLHLIHSQTCPCENAL